MVTFTAETNSTGLTDNNFVSLQAIQGPRELGKGYFRDLLSPNMDLCIAIGGHRG